MKPEPVIVTTLVSVSTQWACRGGKELSAEIVVGAAPMGPGQHRPQGLGGLLIKVKVGAPCAALEPKDSGSNPSSTPS